MRILFPPAEQGFLFFAEKLCYKSTVYIYTSQSCYPKNGSKAPHRQAFGYRSPNDKGWDEYRKA
jgi:hypothetical protein